MELTCPACGGAVEPEQFDDRGELACVRCGEALVWDGALRRAGAPTANLACVQCARPIDPEQFDDRGHVSCIGCGIQLMWDGRLQRADTTAATPPTVTPPTGTTLIAAPATGAPRSTQTATTTRHWNAPGAPVLQPAIAKALRRRSDRWMYVVCGLAGLGFTVAVGYQLSRRDSPAPSPGMTMTASHSVEATPHVAALPAAAPPAATPPTAAPLSAAPLDTTTPAIRADTPALRTTALEPAAPTRPAAPAEPTTHTAADATATSRPLARFQYSRGSARLPPDARPALEAVWRELARAPGAAIEIHGHTDDEGERAANVELSRARGDAVRRWLVRRGIAPGRIHVVGHGPDQPLSAERSAAARADNRRADAILLP